MDKLTRSLGRFTAILTLFACKSLAPVNPDLVEDDLNPVVEDAGRSLCQQACTRWQIMECIEGGEVCDNFDEMTGKCLQWVSCIKWCDNMVASKPGILNLDCIVSAEVESCPELEDVCAE